MAFIREYAEAGDPGFFKKLKRRLRPPKAIRRLKPGRLLGAVAPFIPGGSAVAGILGRVRGAARRAAPAVQQALEAVAAEPPPGVIDLEPERFEEQPLDPIEQLLIALGIGDILEPEAVMVGDPGRRTGAPRPQRRRKAAAAGPRAKAARKRQTRRERSARGRESLGQMFGRTLRGAGSRTAGLGRELLSRDPAALQRILAGAGAAAGAPGLGGKRRRINPTNVKALRRSLRRVEGFEKLAKRVLGHRVLKRRMTAGVSAARGRSHKAGCRCAVCVRAA